MTVTEERPVDTCCPGCRYGVGCVFTRARPPIGRRGRERRAAKDRQAVGTEAWQEATRLCLDRLVAVPSSARDLRTLAGRMRRAAALAEGAAVDWERAELSLFEEFGA